MLFAVALDISIIQYDLFTRVQAVEQDFRLLKLVLCQHVESWSTDVAGYNTKGSIHS